MRTLIKSLLLGGVAVLAVTGTATAADLGAPAPAYVPPPAPFSWAGFYGGINGGYGWGDSEADTPFDIDLSGGLFGGQIGYNMDLGGLILGVEGDIQWSSIGGSIDLGPEVTQTLDWFGTVRARLGYAMGAWMPYVTGGFAWGSATRTSTFGPSEESLSHSGYSVGGGFEYAFTNNMSAKVEYLYIDLGDEDYLDIPADPSVDMNVHTVRFGLNLHF